MVSINEGFLPNPVLETESWIRDINEKFPDSANWQMSFADFLRLEIDKEEWGISLDPRQLLIVKSFYGQPLTDEEQSILDFWKSQDRTTYEPELGHSERTSLILESGRRSGKCFNADMMGYFGDLGLAHGYELVGKALDQNFDSTEALEAYCTENNLIDEIIPFVVPVSVEGQRKSALTNALYIKGRTNTVKIKTRLGYTLEATPEHRVKIMTRKGNIAWRYLGDICSGDRVAIHRSTYHFPEEYVSYPKAYNLCKYKLKGPRFNYRTDLKVNRNCGYVLGLFSSSLQTDVPYLMRTTSDYLDCGFYKGVFGEFLSRLEIENFLYLFQPKGSRDEAILSAMTCERTKMLLDYLGYNENTYKKDKSVPWSIRQSPREVQAAFLSALYDIDGVFDNKLRKLTLKTDSANLAKEVQLMLLNFGIHSRIHERKRANKMVYKVLIRYVYEEVERFAREIGFKLPSNKANLQALLNRLPESNVPGAGIPNQKEWLRKALESLPSCRGMVKRNRKGGGGVPTNYRETLLKLIKHDLEDSRNSELPTERAALICKYLQDVSDVSCPKVREHFENLTECNYFYDSIVSVERSSSFCIDLSVPDIHQYVLQGMTNHNTLIGALIVWYEFMKLIILDSPQKHYGVASNTLISILCLAPSERQTRRTIYGQAKELAPVLPRIRALQKQGKIIIGEKEIKYPAKNCYIYSGNSKSDTQVGGSTICLVMDEAARFKDNNGESNAIELWNTIGAAGVTFREKAKGVAISSAWCEGDSIQALYKGATLQTDWIGFRLESRQVNPKFASDDNPVVRSYFATKPDRAMVEYYGIRSKSTDQFFTHNSINKAFTGVSKIDINRQEEEADRLVRLRIKSISPATKPITTYMHLDPAISNCAYGMAFGHSETNKEGVNLFYVDGIAAWEPDGLNEVGISNVQSIIYEINQVRPLSLISCDQAGYGAETLQRLKSSGFTIDKIVYSSKAQLEMYSALRELLVEGRVILPKNSPWTYLLKKEMMGIRERKGKITFQGASNFLSDEDDEPSGSKDLIDAVVGLVWQLLGRKSYGANSSQLLYTTAPKNIVVPTLLAEENKDEGFTFGSSFKQRNRSWERLK